MKKLLIATLALTTFAAPAFAQQKPGNCALYAELSAETIARDARTEGPQRAVVIDALNTYAAAQSVMADAEMENGYRQYASLGYSKAQVDELVLNTMTSMRNNFHTSTMDENKLYMDHVILVNNCALGAASESEYGQSRESFVSALEQMLAWAQS